MAAEPLTPEENKEMADWALTMALSKARTLSTVETMLSAAISRLDNHRNAWNEYAKDPQLADVRQRIIDLLESFPASGSHYSELITEALGYAVPEQWDYAPVGSDRDLLMRDKGVDPDAEGSEDYELPFEDPLAVFKRKCPKTE